MASASGLIDASVPVRKCQPPAVCGPPVVGQVARLLVGGEPEVVFRVDADDDHVEVLAGVERQRLQRAGHAVEHLRAQHRALVVGEGEHHRARAEELAELHVVAVFVAEHQVERQLLPDLLVDADLARGCPGFGVDRLRIASGRVRVLRVALAGARRASAAAPHAQSLSLSLTARLRRRSAGAAARAGAAGRARRRTGDDLSALPAGIVRPPFDSPPAATVRALERVGELGTDGEALLQEQLLRLVDRHARDAAVLVDPAVAVEMRGLLRAERLQVRPRRRSAARRGPGASVRRAAPAATPTGSFFASMWSSTLNSPHIATSTASDDAGEHDHEPDDRAHIDVALLVNDIRVVGGPVRMVRRHLSAPPGAAARASA